jgi:pyruvate dehydrogenase E1 component beta subunit
MATMTYRDAIREAMREEMIRDERVFLMGEEVGLFGGAYKVSEGMLDEFGPKRVVDTPIAENGFIGAATGAAMLGLRPIVELMTLSFSFMAIDQIINHAAKIHYMFGGAVRVPLVIRGAGGGGAQLTAQHSHSPEVLFAHIPGLIVLAPATPADAKGLLKSAIRSDDPVIFVETMTLYQTKGEVPEGEHLLPFGKADVKKSGRDVTIFTHGPTTVLALQAIKALEAERIDAEIVDLRSLRPLDVETIVSSVKKTTRAVVAEEGWSSYGTNAEIAAIIQEHAFDYLDAPVARVGGAEVPMPYNKTLERAAMPSVDSIVRAVRVTMGVAV